jgi:kinesin family protein 6/9
VERYTDRGIIPRSISMIFNTYRTKTGVEFKAYISYLELYNEQGYDLLDESHETKVLEDLPKVVMLEDEHGNFHLKNLSLHAALTEEEALNLLFRGKPTLDSNVVVRSRFSIPSNFIPRRCR